jgi:hypothetical protein
LQNLLWSILVRSQFLPILLTGDLEKAFLQVRIKEAERDALRFHWKVPRCDDTVVYRFTRALFGLTCLPFLLNGVLNEHLKSWETKHPELVEEIRKNLYVDYLMTGGATITEVKEKKSQAREIFEDATFKLHKWHSNVKELESPTTKDGKFNAFLADNAIEWRFNLSRAPWWGGQFERLIGLFKRAFYKTIGNGTLTLDELEEVVLDVEVALNNRPLTYLEDDIQLPVLTPSSMLNINPCVLPEVDPHYLEDRDLRKRARLLRKSKEAMWKRWSQEYVRSLRENHNQRVGKQTSYPKIGEIVIIRDEVSSVMKGRDDVIRGASKRTSNGNIERAVQHIYPLELSCDETKWNPNPEAPTFTPHLTRDAAKAAKIRLNQVADAEEH